MKTLLLSKLFTEAKNILSSVKKDKETSYRQFYLQNDTNVTRNVISFISIVIGLFTISDFLFFNLSAIFFVLLTFRIGLIFFSIFIVKYLWRLHDFRLYDRACLFWMTMTIIGILAINVSRPQNFLPQIVILQHRNTSCVPHCTHKVCQPSHSCINIFHRTNRLNCNCFQPRDINRNSYIDF